MARTKQTARRNIAPPATAVVVEQGVKREREEPANADNSVNPPKAARTDFVPTLTGQPFVRRIYQHIVAEDNTIAGFMFTTDDAAKSQRVHDAIGALVRSEPRNAVVAALEAVYAQDDTNVHMPAELRGDHARVLEWWRFAGSYDDEPIASVLLY